MAHYCKKKCGDPDFSIKEWNERFKQSQLLGTKPPETGQDEVCIEQCESCINIVLDTKLKNSKLTNKQ